MRNNFDQLMQRTGRFFERGSSGALIMVRSIDSIPLPAQVPLNQWRFPEDLEKHLDTQIDRLACFWDCRADMNDDLIPCLSPHFGIAEHTAFLGGKVDFSEETSWHHPLIVEWSDLDALELREDTPWMRMITDGYRYLAEKSEGRFVLKLRGAEGAMDMSNTLRGNRFFTDLYDTPKEAHRLLEFCNRAAGWFLDRQREIVGSLHGGVMTGFGLWLPGRSSGHLSEDASTMCSAAVYREFGLPYTTRLAQQYDHVFMHVHPLGKHCFADIAGIPGVDVFDICNDPKCPRGMDIYRELGDGCLTGKITGIYPTYNEIADNLAFLRQRRTVLWYDARDMADAERAVELVRTYLNVY